MESYPQPFPIFDTYGSFDPINAKVIPSEFAEHDLNAVYNFLKQYPNKERIYFYLCEIERLLLWAWLVDKKSVLHLNDQDIQKYIIFRLAPPITWIEARNNTRFIEDGSIREPNPHWRPFRATVIKQENKQQEKQDKTTTYQLKQSGVKRIFNTLSQFYDFLSLTGKFFNHSVFLILAQQKDQYVSRRQPQTNVQKLTETQWQYCLATAKQLAADKPDLHEKTLFIITLFYLFYPYAIELTARDGWIPQMNHFYQDSHKRWWFKVLGMKDKIRAMLVGDDMLEALKRYRISVGLTSLPSPTDSMPLLPKETGGKAITSKSDFRKIVQYCFDKTIEQLRENNLASEADTMELATITYLRQTGILNDINKHGFSKKQVYHKIGGSLRILLTHQYNNVPLKERHQSAKNKKLIEEC